MNIIKITIYIFIVILSIIIINMFINCKINENFTTLEENIILPETNSATDRNVHYRIDSTGNYTIDTNVTGFRCGKERDNYYFIDVNPNREQILVIILIYYLTEYRIKKKIGLR